MVDEKLEAMGIIIHCSCKILECPEEMLPLLSGISRVVICIEDSWLQQSLHGGSVQRLTMVLIEVAWCK